MLSFYLSLPFPVAPKGDILAVPIVPNPSPDHSNSNFELQYSKWPKETLGDFLGLLNHRPPQKKYSAFSYWYFNTDVFMCRQCLKNKSVTILFISGFIMNLLAIFQTIEITKMKY